MEFKPIFLKNQYINREQPLRKGEKIESYMPLAHDHGVNQKMESYLSLAHDHGVNLVEPKCVK